MQSSLGAIQCAGSSAAALQHGLEHSGLHAILFHTSNLGRRVEYLRCKYFIIWRRLLLQRHLNIERKTMFHVVYERFQLRVFTLQNDRRLFEFHSERTARRPGHGTER